MKYAETSSISCTMYFYSLMAYLFGFCSTFTEIDADEICALWKNVLKEKQFNATLYA